MEDPAGKFALPESFAPASRPLIQRRSEPPAVRGEPVTASGHPRTLWTGDELAALRREFTGEAEHRPAYRRFLQRVDGLLRHKPSLPPPVEMPPASVTRGHQADAEAVLNLGLAAALTGRSEYADRAVELLLAYARSYADYPLSARPARDRARIFNHRTEMARWLVKLALGYDLVRGRMAGWQRAAVTDGLLRPAEGCVAGDSPPWQDPFDRAASVAAATLAVGYAIDDEELIRRGLDGEEARGGARRLIAERISPDGSFSSPPISQPGPAAEALLVMAECAWRNGADLYGEAGGRIKRLFDAPIKVGYPNRELPALYRNGLDTLLGPNLRLYEYCLERYDDPRHLLLAEHLVPSLGVRPGWMLPRHPLRSGLPAGPVPQADGAVNLDHAGLAVLGAGHGRTANQAVLVYGQSGRDPGNDVLGFSLYGLGRPLMPGPGAAPSDEDKSPGIWYRTRLAENSLVVDGRPQVPSRATLSLLGATEELAVLRAWTDEAYPGVAVDRTLILTRDYLLDLVAVFGGSLHTLDLAYPGWGKLETSLDLEPATSLNDDSLYARWDGLRLGKTKGAWRARWHGPGEQPPLVMTVPAGTETLVRTGKVRLGNREVGVAAMRRRARETAFAAALNLNRDAHFVREVSWVTTGSPSLRSLRVETRRGTDHLLVDYAPASKAPGQTREQAQLVFVRTRKHRRSVRGEGGLDSIYLAGETLLEIPQGTITSSRPALLAFRRMGNGNAMVRNLAGETTDVGLTGLDFIQRAGDPTSDEHVFPVAASGALAAGASVLERSSGSVTLNLPVNTGVEFGPAAEPTCVRRSSTARERFRIAFERVRAARLAAREQALRSRDEAARNPVTPGTAALLEAERFSGQGGGEVEVTDRKVGTGNGRAFLRWDDEGHWLEWSFEVPESGYYRLLLKYCCREHPARRRLEIDGEVPAPGAGVFYLPRTGGWSNNKDDWLLVPLRDYRTGEPKLFYLAEGAHTLRLTNLNHSANLDYLVIASPDVEADRELFE